MGHNDTTHKVKCMSEGCSCLISEDEFLCDTCTRRLVDLLDDVLDRTTIRIYAGGLSVYLTAPTVSLADNHIILRAADVEAFLYIGPKTTWECPTPSTLVITIR